MNMFQSLGEDRREAKFLQTIHVNVAHVLLRTIQQYEGRQNNIYEKVFLEFQNEMKYFMHAYKFIAV